MQGGWARGCRAGDKGFTLATRQSHTPPPPCAAGRAWCARQEGRPRLLPLMGAGPGSAAPLGLGAGETPAALVARMQQGFVMPAAARPCFFQPYSYRTVLLHSLLLLLPGCVCYAQFTSGDWGCSPGSTCLQHTEANGYPDAIGHY